MALRIAFFFLTGALACVVMLNGCAVAVRRESAIAPHVGAPAAEVAPPAPTLGDLAPAQSLPGRGEELWIIEKPAAGAAAGGPLLPGSGMLLNRRGSNLSPFPLRKTEVRAEVNGCIASVEVHQTFSNPTDQIAEADYLFPLPQNGAVNEFVMTIGHRHIRGILRERREAEQIYRDAKNLGYLASLLVQQEPDVFRQRIANIEPGHELEVDIRYFHTLAYREGWFEFVYPMIAGPRGAGWPKVEQRNGRDISVSVRLNPGFAIEKVESPSHAISVEMAGEKVAEAALTAADRIPNRDLVIRCKVAAAQMKTSLMTEPDGDGGAFALLLVPPASETNLARQPLEMVIAVDRSAGAAGKAAAVAVLRNLAKSDTFAIVDLAPNGPGKPAAVVTPIPADSGNVEKMAGALVEGSASQVPLVKILTPEMIRPDDKTRTRIVCIITDGADGNLRDLLATAGNFPRVSALAVGPSPQRETIDAIARRGGGAAVYVPDGGDAMATVADWMQRLSRPAISEAAIDFNEARVSEIFPRRIGDLYVGHAVLIAGRYHGTPPTAATLHGKANGQVHDWMIPAIAATSLEKSSTGLRSSRSPIACVWARMKLADLGEKAVAQPNPSLADDVRATALEYGLMSRFTDFVLVDATTRVQRVPGSATPEPVVNPGR